MTYPKYLILPEPEDFVHGDWATGDVGNAFFYGEVKADAALTHCGSRFCLVGMAAAAFDERGPYPAAIEKPETVKFLRSVCKHLGRPVVEWGIGTAYQASDAFEGVGAFDGLPPITPEQAAEAWRAAAEELGYDVKGAKYRD